MALFFLEALEIPLSGNLLILAGAIALIVVTIALILLLKHIILNSALGAIFWAAAIYVFNINLPYWASLAISIIFGPAGLGVLLFLKFFGIQV